MLYTHKKSLVVSCALLMTSFALPSASVQAQQSLPARFTAFAVSTGGVFTAPVAGTIEISITRWTGDAESAALIATLKKDGPGKFLDAVRDAKSVGSIRSTGNLAYDLRYAQYEDLGDGMTRIVLATDRPMSFGELVNRPPSVDYPFTFVELRVDKEGRGQGKLTLAAAITASRTGRVLQLTNYDSQPIQLNEVKRER